MTLLLALLLGLVQGVTEFLPISSSGHLRLAAAVFGIDDPQTLFDVCVHGGTLGAILAVYRGEVMAMIKGLATPKWENAGFRLVVLVLVGTIPVGLVGILVGDWMEAKLSAVSTVGALLMANGAILMLSRNRGEQGRALSELTLSDAIVIGLAQSLALLRGISRSGTTITTALLTGVNREAAASFSFLLAIPAIAGAVILKLGAALSSDAVNSGPLIAGTLCAFGTGYLALVLLIKLVKQGQLHHFAWYCWGLGLATLIWGL
jgi:undecaprenyl-diphosphatase